MEHQLTSTFRATRSANFRVFLSCLALLPSACRGSPRAEPHQPRERSSAVTRSNAELPPAHSTRSTADAAQPPRSSGTELPPLAGDWLERLEVPRADAAFVAPPIGAREARPVVVAAHGAGDRPEWACGGWRLATQAHAFLLCPRGRATANERFVWTSSGALDEAVSAALRALKARYGDYVRENSLVYAGFSQGAFLAEATLLAVPGRFAAAVFAEGGYDVLANPNFGARYRRAGGERLLIVCGGPTCFGRGRPSLPALERSGLQVWLGGDARAGHNLNQRMQVSLRALWPEFVRGLPGWERFVSAPAAGP